MASLDQGGIRGSPCKYCLVWFILEKGEGECPCLLCFSVASFVKRVIIDCRIKGGIYERDSRIIY
ncbi:hypothetical protein GEZ84_07505 [Streptococcus mitis]|uniref:Uncharacterized protein n=1 Tax=Streptococcus mitis TaxID=28037 RepID=A0A6I1TVZ9_STRMT|nr:hypothetical protein [Streptococcus mitis]